MKKEAKKLKKYPHRTEILIQERTNARDSERKEK